MKKTNNWGLPVVAILWFAFFIVLGGCEPVDYTGMDSKRMAQEALLSELDNCNTAFGSNDADGKRSRNNDYCLEVLDTIDGLIRDGHFDIDPNTLEIPDINGLDVPDTEDEESPQNRMKSAVNDIVGDI